MEIKVITGDIASIKAGAIIVNLFEGMKDLDGDISRLDNILDGAISQLVSQGEIKGNALVLPKAITVFLRDIPKQKMNTLNKTYLGRDCNFLVESCNY